MKNRRKAVIGILAPVDAGKTTLSEALLYNTGKLRKIGRVDHGDAFLDTNEMEKKRGITIYSKQAVFMAGNTEVTLLDTPGHMDFSAEMERTLQVLDAAVLVVSQADSVTGYTRTLWKLLDNYSVPVVVFVNKMDQNGADFEAAMEDIRNRISDRALPGDADDEDIAVLDDSGILLEKYFKEGMLSDDDRRKLFNERKYFPVFAGSALKLEGIDNLLSAIERYAGADEYPDEFGAVVYKITRDGDGNRLTHMKITGGSLSAKEVVPGINEKADRIRIYDGKGYDEPMTAYAGSVAAVMGLEGTYCGQGLGFAEGIFVPEMIPPLKYSMEFPEGTDMHTMYSRLKELEEEEPQLKVSWNEQQASMDISLMGQVQTEIFHDVILERFGVDVCFGSGTIVYLETVKKISEGVGHYEPLRHYSEVHVLIEPLPRGSGMVFDTIADNDVLKPHWQKLILSHMMEKQHKGVLTGSFITDMRISIITGKDHVKHTEPGDMRQSTYRAIRHGLMRNESVLLEPVYSFVLTVPSEMSGRAMTDIQRMYGRFDDPVVEEDMTVITGICPVETMNGYYSEVVSYTKGRGNIFMNVSGYEECHNSDEVIQRYAYDPEADIENQPGSIFCSHGAGYYVPWNEVEDNMHIKAFDIERYFGGISSEQAGRNFESRNRSAVYDDELKAIFERTYGARRKTSRRWSPSKDRDSEIAENARHIDYDNYSSLSENREDRYLLVDGYNCLFAWEDKTESISIARDEMVEMFIEYAALSERKVLLVFDGYKVKGNAGGEENYDNLRVVYTRENQTADAYIEETVAELGKKADVLVASSDSMVQMMSFGSGARRITASELMEDISGCREKIRGKLKSERANGERSVKTALQRAIEDKRQ